MRDNNSILTNCATRGLTDEDISELIVNNKQLVNKIARRYFFVGAEPEDLIQEGMIGLFTAIISYSPEKNNNGFEFFAKKCIERKIQDAIKRNNRLKNSALNEFVEISEDGRLVARQAQTEYDNEDMGIYIPSSAPSPEEEFYSKQKIKEIVSAINTVLSDYERKILQKFIDGLSISEIAEKENTSNKSVSNALARIKVKLNFLNNKQGE